MPEDEKKWYSSLKKIYAIIGFLNMDCYQSSWKVKAETLHNKYKYVDCTYVRCVESSNARKRCIMKKEYFDEQIEIDFEGMEFYAPKGYNEVLTCFYGEYMKLPPIEKQVAHHVNKMNMK